MREFSKSQSYHDNDGNLLHGRAIFYKKDTTTKARIYNADGNIITNPIYTDSIGQLSTQVFLDDIDYTVQFDKYIGDGNMRGDTSEDYWVYQYSCVDLYDTFNIEVNSKSLQVVNTISELRNTDPTTIAESSGNKIINLVGYNKPGDKPAIQYYWDDDSLDSDNNGSVIKVNSISTGRWKFISNQDTIYDVRHFGAFPAMSLSSLSDEQTYAIQQAYNYAAANNAILSFPASEYGIGFYSVTAGLNNVHFDNNTRLLVPTGYNVSIKLADNSEHFTIEQAENYYGIINLEGTHLHNNCVVTPDTDSIDFTKINLKPTERFDLDSNLLESITLSNIDVYIKAGVYSIGSSKKLTLNNCNIHSVNAIAQNLYVNFNGCEIRENMFVSNNNLTNCNFTNCISSKRYWSNTSKYINYWLKNGESMLDLENDTIKATFSLTKNTLIKNTGSLNNTTYVIAENSNIKEIKIVDSNINLSFGNTPVNDINLTIINSTVTLIGQEFNTFICTNSTFTWNATRIYPAVSVADIQNSSIKLTGTFENNGIIAFKNTVGIENSWLDAPLSTTDASTAIIKNCTINKALATTNISLYNNEINADINTYDTYGVIDFYIEGNKFRKGHHNVWSNTPDALVNGKWLNNSSELAEHFIAIDRTNINPSETAHKYAYAGNSGKAVLQKYGSSEVSITIYPNNATTPTVGLKAYILSGVQIAIWMYGHPVKVNFFSVGTKNIDKICDWSMSPDEYIPGVKYYSGVNKGGIDRIFDTNVWAPNYAFPTKTKSLTDIEYSSDNFKNLEFEGGYTWGITFGKPYTQGSVFYCSGDIDGSSPFDYEDKDWWTGLTSATRKVTIYARVRDVYENQGY